ncbi:MAG: cupin domain-containing protein [Verrucomicrobiaceae bacterium]|nr:MAG: cupin domain-containing protein [Verrucomicrobiaceae bacterium]
MNNQQDMSAHRFTQPGEEEVEVIGGKTHLWHSKPGFTATEDLLFVRVLIQPGEGHSFHYHPNKEEIIYFISGTAEQWLEDEMRVMGPGSSLYIPKGVVHATYNRSDSPIEFIAVITPASAEGPVTVEVGERPA